MGVGVYSNDFDGYGTTFLVSTKDYIDKDTWREQEIERALNLGNEQVNFFAEQIKPHMPDEKPEDFLRVMERILVDAKNGSFETLNEVVTDDLKDCLLSPKTTADGQSFSIITKNDMGSQVEFEIPKVSDDFIIELREAADSVQDFESWATMTSEDADNDFDAELKSAIKNLGGSPVTWREYMDDDIQCIAEIDKFQIGVRGWEGDTVVAVAVNESFKEQLEQYENGERLLSAIMDEGIDPYNVGDHVADCITALRVILVQKVQSIGFDAAFKTSGYTTEKYAPVTEEELGAAKKVFSDWQKQEMTDEKRFELLEKFIDDKDLNCFYHVVNLDERGDYSAEVRRIFDDETVFEIKSDEDGEISLVSDGFMKNVDDTKGLSAYLQEMGTINKPIVGSHGEAAKTWDDALDEEDFSENELIRAYLELKEKVEGKQKQVVGPKV